MIKIDGSIGGGQLLRSAVSLSVLTKQDFSIYNIRKNRFKSGFQPQHLSVLDAYKQIFDVKEVGAIKGGDKFDFYTGELKGKSVKIDIGTAGSITLLLQSLLFPLCFSRKNVKIEVIGGTEVNWSPTIDYFKEVILPQFEKYSEVDLAIEKRGYFPKGGGKVTLRLKNRYLLKNYDNIFELGKDVPKINLINSGKLLHIKGLSNSVKEFENINLSERLNNGAKLLLNKLNVPVRLQSNYVDSLSKGSSTTLYSIHSLDEDEIDFNNPIRLGVDSLNDNKLPPEKMGFNVANKLLNLINNNVPVDEHLGDNLIIPLMFGGRFKVNRISEHIKSNISLTESFIKDNFKIKNNIISLNPQY